MNKKTILVFVDWFWPGYLAGGPVQSITSLISYLGETYNFKVVTSNHDLNTANTYNGISSDLWTRSQLGCDVFYLSAGNTTVTQIRRLLVETRADCIYINSFFSLYFSVLPLFLLKLMHVNTPVIIAPRGMLGSGALAIKKYKKQLFMFLARLVGLHKNLIWHATSEQEGKEIELAVHSPRKTVIVQNLPKKLAPLRLCRKERGQLSLCFVSRITYKKNLIFVTDILSGLSCNVDFKIYGPIEDKDYWEKCITKLKNLPANVKYEYEGPINPNFISEVFAKSHVMVLPTHNENFGHAIIEALSCGCPVVISDQTPWNDLESYKAGFAIPLRDKERFVEALLHYCEMDQADFDICRQNATFYVKEKIDVNSIVSQYKTLFDGCVNK